MPDDRANPRKAELRQLLERAETLEASLDGVLSPARAALGAGAWVSSAARPFEEGLEEARRGLVRGAQATTAALRAELASTPARIPALEVS